ncbi:MAG: cytochrome c [Sphingobacteriales bacterium]|jgi:hypothetical protein
MMRFPFSFIALLLFVKYGQSQGLTFIKDVAPIIHTKCTPCHRPNESAPFSLITYEDVSKRASFIKEVISSGYMPPWRSDNHYVSYSNDRSLTEKEKSTIISWIDQNVPKGTGEIKTVELSAKVSGKTGYHRPPDATITMNKSFILPGDNVERFIVYRIPFELKDSMNVEAIEFYSNNKKIIHHVNYSIHQVPESIPLQSGPDMINLTEDDPSLTEQWKPLKKTIEYYGGWIPGASYENYPKGMGWIMPKRGVIMLTLHLAPAAKDEELIAGVNLFYTPNKVQRKVKVISFGSGGIGEKQISPPLTLFPNRVQTFNLQLMNPSEDFSVMYVWPHMHLLGKSFKAFAITPSGDTVRLAHIPNWDFRWQEIYRFKKLQHIPKGSKLFIEGVYDNTINNPFNPNKPPRLVMSTGNMETTNEMLTMLMVFLPYKSGDENLGIDVPKPLK